MSRVIKASRITGEYRIAGANLIRKGRFDRVIEQKLGDEKKMKKEEKIRTAEPEEERVSRQKALEKAEKEKTAEIVKKAEEKAAAILAEARSEIEEEKDKAREEGFQQGYSEGLEAGQGELSDSLTTLGNLVDKMKAELNEQIEILPAQVIKLSHRIASKIVGTRLEINPELINGLVQEMVADMNSFQELTIKVNPRLLPYLEQGNIEERFSGQEIKFSGDNSLEVGDCLIESEMGGRDGRLETKLDLLERQLLEGTGFHAGY